MSAGTCNIKLTVVASALVLTLLGCAAPSGSSRADGVSQSLVDSLWAREDLFFGMSIPGGGVVTDSAWQQFVDGEITPRFPSGLTVIKGRGQYMQEDRRLAKEDSRIVTLVHPNTPSNYESSIVRIIEIYKERFSQESVLRVTSPVKARF